MVASTPTPNVGSAASIQNLRTTAWGRYRPSGGNYQFARRSITAVIQWSACLSAWVPDIGGPTSRPYLRTAHAVPASFMQPLSWRTYPSSGRPSSSITRARIRTLLAMSAG